MRSARPSQLPMALRARRVTWPARPLARAQNPLIARTALPRRAADRSTRRAAAPRLERFGSWQVRPGHPTCRWPRVRSARCARPRERAARKEPTPTACRARRRGRSGQRDGLPACGSADAQALRGALPAPPPPQPPPSRAAALVRGASERLHSLRVGGSAAAILGLV